MFFAGSKKLKTGLSLAVFIGIVFSLSCAFDFHSEVLAGTSAYESITAPAQGTKTCPLKEAFITLPKNHARDVYDVLAIGLILVSLIIVSWLFKYIKQHFAYLVRLYTRHHLEISASHYLRVAFSRGILNPKKYNLAFN